VDKISLPFRILLVVFVVFAAVWFVALRPKPVADVAPATTSAPGVTGLSTATDKAKSAVAAANAAAAAKEAAANAVGGSSTTTKPSATTAKPVTPAGKPVKPAAPGLAADAAPDDPSRPLLASVDAGKVVVVLFWNKNASDDRATRQGLRKVDLHHGKVVVSAIPLAEVGRYEAITRGAQVLESPTVLVIGAGGKARAITGYTQANEIDQAVSDIGGKGFQTKKAFELTGFAKVADDACKDFDFAFAQKTDFPATRPALIKYLDIGASELRKTGARLKRTPATGATASAFKASLIAFVDRDIALATTASRQLRGTANPADVVTTFFAGQDAAEKHMVVAAKKARARGCWA
jgi:hypothetical protein